MGLRSMLKRFGKLSSQQIDEVIEGLKQGQPYVVARSIPEDIARAAARNAEGMGIEVKVASGAVESLSFRPEEARTLLRDGQRTEALKLLVAAAQWNEEALDILVEDALERGDAVQADHWETKRAQLRAASSATPAQNSGGGASGRWAGFGVSMPVDGL